MKRQAPIAISYFKALRNTPINVEFGARFPREDTNNKDPQPFEVEVADFIGRLNVLIYENIGKFTEEEIANVQDKSSLQKENDLYVLPREEREKRLRTFLEILLTPKYVLPRRTNSLNVPEYKVAVIVLNRDGVLPVYQYLGYTKPGEVDLDKLERLKEIVSEAESEAYVIDYEGWIKEDVLPKISVKEAINKIIDHVL